MECTGFDLPGAIGYFHPDLQADVDRECLQHFEKLYRYSQAIETIGDRDGATCSTKGDCNISLALTAAGLLTYGRIEAIEVLLDNIYVELRKPPAFSSYQILTSIISELRIALKLRIASL